MKYEIGDLVSKPVTGICKIDNFLYLNPQDEKNNKLYYLMKPVEDEKEKIYVPVSNSDARLRLCLTKEEARMHTSYVKCQKSLRKSRGSGIHKSSLWHCKKNVRKILFDFLKNRKYNYTKRVASKRKSSLPAARFFVKISYLP